MLRIVVVGVVVVVAGVLGLAATRPDTFRVQRAIRIQAPPEKVFGLIEDLRRWRAWSPYEAKDPAMRRTYSGAPQGAGAVYEWNGNKEIGQGRMEITRTSPPSLVAMRLDFVRPFEAHNLVEFLLSGTGGATTVTWAIHGPRPFMAKLMCLFLDVDRMIGRDFETGLANLKAAAES